MPLHDVRLPQNQIEQRGVRRDHHILGIERHAVIQVFVVDPVFAVFVDLPQLVGLIQEVLQFVVDDAGELLLRDLELHIERLEHLLEVGLLHQGLAEVGLDAALVVDLDTVILLVAERGGVRGIGAAGAEVVLPRPLVAPPLVPHPGVVVGVGHAGFLERRVLALLHRPAAADHRLRVPLRRGLAKPHVLSELFHQKFAELHRLHRLALGLVALENVVLGGVNVLVEVGLAAVVGQQVVERGVLLGDDKLGAGAPRGLLLDERLVVVAEPLQHLGDVDARHDREVQLRQGGHQQLAAVKGNDLPQDLTGALLWQLAAGAGLSHEDLVGLHENHTGQVALGLPLLQDHPLFAEQIEDRSPHPPHEVFQDFCWRGIQKPEFPRLLGVVLLVRRDLLVDEFVHDLVLLVCQVVGVDHEGFHLGHHRVERELVADVLFHQREEHPGPRHNRIEVQLVRVALLLGVRRLGLERRRRRCRPRRQLKVHRLLHKPEALLLLHRGVAHRLPEVLHGDLVHHFALGEQIIVVEVFLVERRPVQHVGAGHPGFAVDVGVLRQHHQRLDVDLLARRGLLPVVEPLLVVVLQRAEPGDVLFHQIPFVPDVVAVGHRGLVVLEVVGDGGEPGLHGGLPEHRAGAIGAHQAGLLRRGGGQPEAVRGFERVLVFVLIVRDVVAPVVFDPGLQLLRETQQGLPHHVVGDVQEVLVHVVELFLVGDHRDHPGQLLVHVVERLHQRLVGGGLPLGQHRIAVLVEVGENRPELLVALEHGVDVVEHLGGPLGGRDRRQQLIQHVIQLVLEAEALLLVAQRHRLRNLREVGADLDLVGLNDEAFDGLLLGLFKLDHRCLGFLGGLLGGGRLLGLFGRLHRGCCGRGGFGGFPQLDLAQRELLRQPLVSKIQIDEFTIGVRFHLNHVLLEVRDLAGDDCGEIAGEDDVDPLPGEQPVLPGVAVERVTAQQRYHCDLVVVEGAVRPHRHKHFVQGLEVREQQFGGIDVGDVETLVVQLGVAGGGDLDEVPELQSDGLSWCGGWCGGGLRCFGFDWRTTHNIL